MKTQASTSETLDSSAGVLGRLWWVCFLFSLVSFALGQPDRHPLFSFIAYLIAFPLFFYSILSVDSKSVRFAVTLFWASGVELFQLNWLATTYYHGSGILIAYSFLCVGVALQFALLTLFLPKRLNMRIGYCFLMAAIWTICEWSRLFYLCGFPFGIIGQLLTFDAVPMQMASVVGVYGLSFWIVLVGCWGGYALVKRSASLFVCWSALAVFPLLFGLAHFNYRHKLMEDAPVIRVALMQTGLASEQKWAFPGQESLTIGWHEQWRRIFLELAKSTYDKFDLIVLPEVALPGDAFQSDLQFDEVVSRLIRKNDRLPPLKSPLARRSHEGHWLVSNAWVSQALANLYQSEVIVGLLDYNYEKDENYNSAFHFVPFRTLLAKYNKRVLVPMSEYLPLPIFSSFVEKYGISTFFTKGTQPALFLGQIPISASICYEEGFNNLIREGRVKGAEMFVNVTNDGWFPNSRLPVEHFNLGKVRAIENGVPVLRACNTGISAVINSLGETVKSMGDVDKGGNVLSGAVISNVNCYAYDTIFSKLGNGLILLISGIIILISLIVNKAGFLRDKGH